MNRRIWKALGIAVCMLALAAPRAMAETYKVGKNAPFIKFGDAVEAINQSGDDKNEIVLMENITLGGDPTQYTLYTLSRGETTIKGGGNKITISNAGITVAKKGTVLNLGANGYDGTLTIDGKTSGGFVSVLEGATANMYENVTLQNWTSAGNACVVIMGSDPVTGSKSVFNMHGGVIEKCSRAVMADSGTTFNMSGGEIRNCVSMNDGGGLYADNSTINITGGTISGCTAVIGHGGGLYANNSAINISDGTISGCEGRWGGGLYATNSSKITISGGTMAAPSADVRQVRAAVCLQTIQPSPSAAAQSADVRENWAAVCMQQILQKSPSVAAPSADVRGYGAAVCTRTIQPSPSPAVQSADVR